MCADDTKSPFIAQPDPYLLVFSMRSLKLLLLPAASVMAAPAMTWALWPYIQPSSSPLFFVAIMWTALYGGLAAGLIATALSTASIAYFFMVPRFSFNVGPDDAFRLLAFGAV